MPRKLLNILLPAATGALFIAAWYAVCFSLNEDNRFLLPTPGQVLGAIRDNGDILARATFNTAEGGLLGFSLAIVFSFSFALLLSLSPLIRVSLQPYLMIMQLVPTIVLGPILVLWVGPGLKSVTIITFLICFFPLVVNTTQGLISTDRDLVDLFKTYKATRRQEIFLLRVPAALPYFFTGLRIAAVLAPIGAIVGDYTAGNSAGNGGGLGFRVIIYSSQAQYPALFATVVISCLLGLIFVAAVLALSRLALHKWHDSFERTDV
jgi:NitT/TauT family transport system permease protein